MERKFTVRNTLVSAPRYKLVAGEMTAFGLKREIAKTFGNVARAHSPDMGLPSLAKARGPFGKVVAKAVETVLMRHSVKPADAVEIVNVRQARNLSGKLDHGRIRLTTRGRKSEIREDTLVTMRYDMLGEVISSAIPEPTLADVFAERPDLPAATRLKFAPQRGGRLPKLKL